MDQRDGADTVGPEVGVGLTGRAEETVAADYRLGDVFNVTAARMSVFSALASIFSPS